MNPCKSISKYVLFIFNLLILLAAIALLALSVVLYCRTLDVIPEAYRPLAVYLSIPGMVVASIMIIISFCGCCGAISECHCLLITYSVVMVILCAAKIVLVVLVVVYGPEETDLVATNMVKDTEPQMLHLWEIYLSCCGTTGPEFYRYVYPERCCPAVPGETMCLRENTFPGCRPVLKNTLQHFCKIIIISFSTVAGLEMLIFILTLCVTCASEDRKKYLHDGAHYRDDIRM